MITQWRLTSQPNWSSMTVFVEHCSVQNPSKYRFCSKSIHTVVRMTSKMRKIRRWDEVIWILLKTLPLTMAIPRSRMFKVMNPDKSHPSCGPVPLFWTRRGQGLGWPFSPWELIWMVDIWSLVASRSCFAIILRELEELSTRKHKSTCKWSTKSPSWKESAGRVEYEACEDLLIIRKSLVSSSCINTWTRSSSNQSPVFSSAYV